MTHAQIAKIIQVAAVVAAGIMFFVVKGNVKYFVLAALTVALVGHFYEYITGEVKIALGSVQRKFASKL
jgi:hypothetical protein